MAKRTNMIKPALFDVIELLQPLVHPLPEQNLPAGSQGTILDQYNDHTFEVEFSDDLGRTIALAALSREQFIVVWQAENKQVLPLADQVAQLVELLPASRQRSPRLRPFPDHTPNPNQRCRFTLSRLNHISHKQVRR
jgi:hypothetical protein